MRTTKFTKEENRQLQYIHSTLMDINDVNMRTFGPVTSVDMATAIFEVATDKKEEKIKSIAMSVLTWKRCSDKQAWCMAFWALNNVACW